MYMNQEQRREWIEESIRKMGISKAEAARRIGISPSALINTLHNGRTITDKFLARFCDGLSIDKSKCFKDFAKDNMNFVELVAKMRDAQRKHKETLNYGYRCLAARLEKEVDEMLETL